MYIELFIKIEIGVELCCTCFMDHL